MNNIDGVPKIPQRYLGTLTIEKLHRIWIKEWIINNFEGVPKVPSKSRIWIKEWILNNSESGPIGTFKI